MIPKIIHYCWFGRNSLPASAQKCIASWRKYFPDYEIKEWNEDIFNVNIIPYTQQAYEAQKYAFVSDYARFWILYHYGGLYFDTDVEVIKSFDDIVDKGAFMGLEIDGTKKDTKMDTKQESVMPPPHGTVWRNRRTRTNMCMLLMALSWEWHRLTEKSGGSMTHSNRLSFPRLIGCLESRIRRRRTHETNDHI